MYAQREIAVCFCANLLGEKNKYDAIVCSGIQCSVTKEAEGVMLSRCHDLGLHSRQGISLAPHYSLALLVPFAVL